MQTLPLRQNLYHPSTEDTEVYPVKAAFGILLQTVFSLANFCSSLSLITSNRYVYFFSVSSPKASCCSHRSFPVIAFLCTIPQLWLMLLMNLIFFFFLVSTFRSLNFSGRQTDQLFFYLGSFLSLSATLFSISLCLQHTSFDEFCYWIAMKQIDMFHYNFQGKMA